MVSTHYFYAVTLPESVKISLREQATKLEKQFLFKKWLHYADYHITMAFLGSASDIMKKTAIQNVALCLEGESRFNLTLHKLATFGRPERPRILWQGIDDAPELFHLQAKVFEACRQAGFALDTKPFTPHITLARKYVGDDNFSLEEANETLSIHKESFEVTTITLYRTHIGATPSYEPIYSFTLQ